MPANIAHILIANAAYDKIKETSPEVAEQILWKNNHFYLGSLGPDLPSYKTSELVKAALEQLLIRPFVDKTNPQEEDASFFLHSTRPNLFPYYLMETNMSFADLKQGKLQFNDFNYAVYSFTLGYVCHIAADQIVHRLVREIVGPYYRSLTVSKKHADCEVHQDIFLFYELFADRSFSKTVVADLVTVDKLGFEYDMFCNLLSLAISKAGYSRIDKDDIDGWLDGIKLTFELMDDIGPYTSVLKEYPKQKANIDLYPPYKRYFRNPDGSLDYMHYFNKAVDLAVKYMSEIIDLWKNPNFSAERFLAYQNIIQPDDLTAPFRDDL